MCTPTRLPKNLLKQMGPPLALVAPAQSAAVIARPNTSPSSVESRRTIHRRHFLLFVRVLIKCIEQSQNYKLKLQAKAMVSECVKRNRMGDPHFSPLQESLELRLRGLVGPDYWNQAKDYMHCYHTARSQQQGRGPQRVLPVAL